MVMAAVEDSQATASLLPPPPPRPLPWPEGTCVFVLEMPHRVDLSGVFATTIVSHPLLHLRHWRFLSAAMASVYWL